MWVCTPLVRVLNIKKYMLMKSWLFFSFFSCLFLLPSFCFLVSLIVIIIYSQSPHLLLLLLLLLLLFMFYVIISLVFGFFAVLVLLGVEGGEEEETRLMKRLVALLLLLALSCAVEHDGVRNDGQCKYKKSLEPRPHSVSILEFGAVGDGKTPNTIAFQNAVFYLKSFADKGGAQLYVPPGQWLTGSFVLTSHLTLFLERGATILGSQNLTHWEIVDPLPSYGRGIELPGGQYRSLITGQNLTDVVITGNNGTIDGQGSVWWENFSSHSLKYSRPHVVEFINSSDIIISNLTFLNSPAWSIHPVYCSHVRVQNITAHAPPESPYTSGVVPDSSESVCIEDSNISMGYDAVALKSGWDEYGIAYGRPTRDVHIRRVRLRSRSGSGLAFGSEMSGGISNILVESIQLRDSSKGVTLKTAKGRGGYIKDILISDVEMENVVLAIGATGQCTSHPDDKYDPVALPAVDGITFKDIVGTKISIAGNFSGIYESPFTSICLFNISLSVTANSTEPWFCSNVSGSSEDVSPQPCPNLQTTVSRSSSTCPSFPYKNTLSAVS